MRLCHWAWHDLLGLYGATPDAGRVVRDDKVITGGGETAPPEVLASYNAAMGKLAVQRRNEVLQAAARLPAL